MALQVGSTSWLYSFWGCEIVNEISNKSVPFHYLNACVVSEPELYCSYTIHRDHTLDFTERKYKRRKEKIREREGGRRKQIERDKDSETERWKEKDIEKAMRRTKVERTRWTYRYKERERERYEKRERQREQSKERHEKKEIKEREI